MKKRFLVLLLALPFSGFTDCQHWSTLLLCLFFRSGTLHNRTPSPPFSSRVARQRTVSGKSRVARQKRRERSRERGWRKCQRLCENKAKKSFLNAA